MRPEDAAQIVLDVSSALEVDRERVAAAVNARFVPGCAPDELDEAERVAAEVIEEVADELVRACEEALAQAHELYLRQVAAVFEARADLATRGGASWIARAVLNDQALRFAWDALDHHELLAPLTGCDEAAGDGREEVVTGVAR